MRPRDQKIIDTIPAYKSGIIVNSYYTPGTNNAFVDVVIQGVSGNTATTYAKVPVMKTGGMSVTLPMVGSSGIVGFLDNNETKPFLIGYIESTISRDYAKDDEAPRKPPTSLTR